MGGWVGRCKRVWRHAGKLLVCVCVHVCGPHAHPACHSASKLYRRLVYCLLYCLQVEAELNDLDEADAAEYLADLGVEEGGLKSLIRCPSMLLAPCWRHCGGWAWRADVCACAALLCL